MVIDTSAMVAILKGEVGAEVLVEAINTAPDIFLSTATLLETGIIIESRFDQAVRRRFEALLDTFAVRIMVLTTAHADEALKAFRKYGKGRHPAGLNFGDCFAYGLAKSLNQPLLFVGNDFSRTDIRPAC